MINLLINLLKNLLINLFKSLMSKNQFNKMFKNQPKNLSKNPSKNLLKRNSKALQYLKTTLSKQSQQSKRNLKIKTKSKMMAMIQIMKMMTFFYKRSKCLNRCYKTRRRVLSKKQLKPEKIKKVSSETLVIL